MELRSDQRSRGATPVRGEREVEQTCVIMTAVNFTARNYPGYLPSITGSLGGTPFVYVLHNPIAMSKYLYSLAFAALTISGLHAQEICDNGIDDDADGLIDLNDTTDCGGDIVDGLPYLLPNRSFELFDCLPVTYTQLECADTWSQATDGTSDYFRTESYMPAFIPQPLPFEGNGCVGGYICPDYMEYIGGCLTEPLVAGSTYTLHLSITGVEVDNQLQFTDPLDLGPVDITVWGLDNCPAWPLPTLLSPESLGWSVVGTATYTPTTAWTELDISLEPGINTNAIMFGSPSYPVDYPDAFSPFLGYMLYDEMSVSESNPQVRSMLATGSLCQGNMKIHVDPIDASSDLQWYHDGVALLNEIDRSLDVSLLGLGNGMYACRVGTNGTTTLARYVVEDPSFTQPLVQAVGEGLLCTSNGFYQWYLNGSAIYGATSSFYVPVVNGTYTVEVTGGEGCSAASEAVEFTVTGVPGLQGTNMHVMHAPGTDVVTVTGATAPFNFRLLDIAGRLVASEQGTGATWQYNMAALPEGVYTAVVNDVPVRLVR